MSVREPEGGQLEILSKSELDKIHGATVEVFSRLGVKVWAPKALALFKAAGAEVDQKTMTVKISESLLKETVKKAPAEFEMYGRDPKYKLTYGGKRVHYSTVGQPVRLQDLDGNVRSATVKDMENLAKIADYCDNIHHLSRMTTPLDVPQDVQHLHCIWANCKNSIKTTNGYNHGERKAQETIDMAAIIRGSHDELVKKPLLLGITNPVSPMQLSQQLIEGAILYAKYKQPMVYAPEIIAGATGPVTLAGVLVQQNAEVLAGIMVSQLANPGTPVMYGTVCTVLDMKTGATALGGPEVGLYNVASAQLARYYSLPSRGTGGNTDSKVLDSQAASETATGVLMASLAGMNFIYDAAGSLDGSLTLSYEKLVIDNEVCGMVSRILDGVAVNDQTLAVDEICRVGPSATYLASPFTMKMFRKEHFIPALLDRKSRETWEKEGAKSLETVAREKTRSILKEHMPEPIDKGVAADVEKFMKKVTKSYAR